MASTKQESKPAEGVEESVELDPFVPENWEFIDRTPTREEVDKLLDTLPKWWGVAAGDFGDYVQGLPSNKKVKVQQPKQRGDGFITVDKNISVVTLYFSVAGRIQMMRSAQEKHGWRVDFEPEPTTPTGIPGYLEWGDRLVYRVNVKIWAPTARAANPERIVGQLHDVSEGYALLGVRSGTAWVPATGGKQAAGSNPYEKVETSALGRALGGWGIGVLPGSGVATLEEMAGVRQNRQALEGEAAQAQVQAESEKLDPAELREQVMAAAEEARQLLDGDDGWGVRMVQQHLLKNQGVDVATLKDQDGTVLEIDLDLAKPAQLLLVRNAFRKRVQEIKAEQQKAAIENG